MKSFQDKIWPDIPKISICNHKKKDSRFVDNWRADFQFYKEKLENLFYTFL